MRLAMLAFAAAFCVSFGASQALAAEQPARRAKTSGPGQEAKRPNPCDSYGPGFRLLPGTTTCVRVGGAVVGDFSTGSPASNLGVK